MDDLITDTITNITNAVYIYILVYIYALLFLYPKYGSLENRRHNEMERVWKIALLAIAGFRFY